MCISVSKYHCLVSMIGKWRESVCDGGAFGTFLTDLSKAFHCLHHNLLIENLDAYGFNSKLIRLIQQYLSNRRERVKVSNAYNSRKESFLRYSSELHSWSTYFQDLFVRLHIFFGWSHNSQLHWRYHILES